MASRRPAVNRAQILERVVRITDELADVRKELERVLAVDEPEFSSVDLPPGVSRRTFRERCASGVVEGARREGHTWRCSRRAWFASSRRPVARTLRDTKPENAAADVDALLAGAGLRATRRTA